MEINVQGYKHECCANILARQIYFNCARIYKGAYACCEEFLSKKDEFFPFELFFKKPCSGSYTSQKSISPVISRECAYNQDRNELNIYSTSPGGLALKLAPAGPGDPQWGTLVIRRPSPKSLIFTG